MLTRLVMSLIITGGPSAWAVLPVEALNTEMEKFIAPLQKSEGWPSFIAAHPDLFTELTSEKPGSFVAVGDHVVTIDGKEYKIGIGSRMVFVAASPRSVVAVMDSPKFFQSLYGLDKPAEVEPASADGSFKGHIFKLVPGIETQDYTLQYTQHWSGPDWLGQARLIKDERNFALRNNIKIVQAKGSGSIFREVALFVPQRWWMNLLHGTVQKITKSELTKLNVSLKCAAEKIQGGAPMSEDVAKTCYKEATK